LDQKKIKNDEEESDIEDDLDEEKLKKNGGFYVTPQMYEKNFGKTPSKQ